MDLLWEAGRPGMKPSPCGEAWFRTSQAHITEEWPTSRRNGPHKLCPASHASDRPVGPSLYGVLEIGLAPPSGETGHRSTAPSTWVRPNRPGSKPDVRRRATASCRFGNKVAEDRAFLVGAASDHPSGDPLRGGHTRPGPDGPRNRAKGEAPGQLVETGGFVVLRTCALSGPRRPAAGAPRSAPGAAAPAAGAAGSTPDRPG